MDPKRISSVFHRILVYLIYLFTLFSLFTIAGTHISIGIIVSVWMAHMIVTKHWLISKTPLDLSFLLLVMACIISTVFSVRPHESFIHLKNITLIGVVYIIASHIREKKEVVRLLDLFIFGSAILALIGLLSTDIMGGKRVRSFQGITMTWGSMSVIFSLITASLFLFVQSCKKRWLYLCAFIFQFVGMLFSYVRGSWVGFIAGFFILVMVKSKKLLFGGIIAILFVILLSPDPLRNRMLSIADLSINSTQVRFVQWKNAVKIFQDYPIVGVGWIDLNEIHRQYAPPDADLSWAAYQIGHFHNNYVMFLVCFGIVGFAAMAFMIFKLFQTTYRIYRCVSYEKSTLSAYLIGSIAALTGFWINGFFDWTFGDAETVTLLWFTVGLSIAIGKIACEDKK
ncbi:O-antigen ligase family protein [bacterium]|nr:O-antigen ligase family protein [bacterium]